MFDKLDTPRELLTHKLGAALQMEQTVLKMLGNLQEEAQDGQLTELFRHHADETRQQIRNLELAFEAIGEKPDDKPCPAIEGIDKEGKANVKKASDQLVDAVILSGAAETEHHEIAVYEGLITQAEALGEPSVVTLLRQNLEQEEHTLDEVRRAAQAVAQRTRHVAA